MPNSSPDSPMAGADRQTPRRLLRLHLPAEQVSLLVVAEAVEALAESDDWPAEARFHVDLVLEELVQNIVSYGFPDGRSGEFELTIDREGADLIIVLDDNGVAFDPFSLATPDTNLPLEERSIGGLGVHFTRTLMSAYGYRREGDRNWVELRKSLDSPISAD